MFEIPAIKNRFAMLKVWFNAHFYVTANAIAINLQC